MVLKAAQSMFHVLARDQMTMSSVACDEPNEGYYLLCCSPMFNGAF